MNGFDSTVANDGVCSLREAIASANTDTPSGSAPGECPAGAGRDTVVLTGDVALTALHDAGTGSALPAVTTGIELVGEGAAIIRDPAATYTSTITVRSGGDLRIEGVVFDGGLIECRQAEVLLESCQLNDAVVRGVEGDVSIVDSVLAGTSDETVGTAVTAIGPDTDSVKKSSLLIKRSSISGYLAEGPGGVLVSEYINFELIDSVVYGNEGTGGVVVSHAGGIYIGNPSSFLGVNSTISGNSGGQAGGIRAFGPASFELIHSTVTGNDDGAALVGDFATLEIIGSVLGGNVFANCALLSSSTIVDGGGNRADDATCGTIPASLSGLDSTLQDNGGPTMTHALLVGSSAIGAGGDCGSSQGLLVDQRGALRDGACDSGAYEYGANDQYEFSGYLGHDDECPGHRIQFGSTERHLFREDPDWVRFASTPGALYVIETGRLLNNADTVLTLYRGCGQQLAENDDWGGSVASRIEYMAAEGDGELDLQVSNFNSLYEAGKGYDLKVTCVSGCPACMAPGGDGFVLHGETVYTDRTIESCSSIEIGDSTVKTGAVLTLQTPGSVIFNNDSVIEASAGLVVGPD